MKPNKKYRRPALIGLVAFAFALAFGASVRADLVENIITAQEVRVLNDLKVGDDLELTGSLAVGGGSAVVEILSGTGTIDFASAAANVCSTDDTITVTGAAVGDPVFISVPTESDNAGSTFSAWVTDDDVVTVRHCNHTGSANDPASGTFRAVVFSY